MQPSIEMTAEARFLKYFGGELAEGGQTLLDPPSVLQGLCYESEHAVAGLVIHCSTLNTTL